MTTFALHNDYGPNAVTQVSLWAHEMGVYGFSALRTVTAKVKEEWCILFSNIGVEKQYRYKIALIVAWVMIENSYWTMHG